MFSGGEKNSLSFTSLIGIGPIAPLTEKAAILLVPIMLYVNGV
jgi:hypothetical protein